MKYTGKIKDPKDLVTKEYVDDSLSPIQTDLTDHIDNATIHVTSDNKTKWNAKYDKPSTGIPKSDLAESVQTSLGLADTSVQDTWEELSPTITKTSSGDGVTFGAEASTSGVVLSSGWDIKIEDADLQTSLVAVLGSSIIC